MNICVVCSGSFEPPARNPKRQTCSKRCSSILSWRTTPDRAASISKAQKRRGAEIAEMNRRRWTKPGEREKLSERNRKAWADPVAREKLSARIRRSHRRPELRRFYSEMRKALWQDPEYRARVTAAVAAGHRTEKYRALFSALLRERWKDPVWRGKWLAAMRRRYGHAIAEPTPEPPEPVPAAAQAPEPTQATPRASPDRRSPMRRAEEDAIAAFLAEKGLTKLPGVGDPELGKLPPLQWDRQVRRFTRPKIPTGA